MERGNTRTCEKRCELNNRALSSVRREFRLTLRRRAGFSSCTRNQNQNRSGIKRNVGGGIRSARRFPRAQRGSPNAFVFDVPPLLVFCVVIVAAFGGDELAATCCDDRFLSPLALFRKSLFQVRVFQNVQQRVQVRLGREIQSRSHVSIRRMHLLFGRVPHVQTRRRLPLRPRLRRLDRCCCSRPGISVVQERLLAQKFDRFLLVRLDRVRFFSGVAHISEKFTQQATGDSGTNSTSFEIGCVPYSFGTTQSASSLLKMYSSSNPSSFKCAL